MDNNELFNETFQSLKRLNIYIYIFSGYSILMILLIPSFVKERLIIGSSLFDFLLRVFIVFSLYQSVHFVFYFEESVSKFYGNTVSFKVSELDGTKKIFYMAFSILSGLSTYLILYQILKFYIPFLGPITKICAFIFGMYIVIPMVIKIKPINVR